jgi:hypothetical protein
MLLWLSRLLKIGFLSSLDFKIILLFLIKIIFQHLRGKKCLNFVSYFSLMKIQIKILAVQSYNRVKVGIFQ